MVGRYFARQIGSEYKQQILHCRYYYDGDMISKVQGKRFVYKFVCDLKSLIGYTASELNSLVIEAEQRALGSISTFNTN